MSIRLLHVVLATAMVALVGCATATANRSNKWREGTTTIKISGKAGSPFTAFYLREGQRYDLTNSVPFTLTQTGLTECEIRKVNLNDVFTVEARFDHPDMHLTFSSTAAAGIPGVRVEVHNGLAVENLRN